MKNATLLTTAGDRQDSSFPRKMLLIGLTVFAVGILYYCYAYLLRVYPSVMMPGLISRFGIDAGSFGLLTSFYYFAYAPMQLPVGMSVDRIGPRRSLLMACLIAIAGTAIFATTKQYSVALVGRFLVGFGAAFAYVTALKIASQWLPQRYFATATGVVTGSGMVAAIFTDMYLTYIVQHKGYDKALHFPFLVGIGLFFVILLVVRDKPKQKLETAEAEEVHALTFRQLFQYVGKLMRNPQMWLIGVVGAFLYLPATVFLDVWGIPYLKVVYHLSAEDAAYGVSITLVGWIFSSFITGALSDWLGTRKIPLVIATLGAAVTSAIILYAPGIDKFTLFALLFILGAFCGPHPLTFTLSKENNTSKISGTAISFANFVIMMGGFIFQPVVGWLLDLGWDGHTAHGVPVYSAHDYTLSLSILPVALALAGVIVLMIKETYHRAKDK